MARPAKWRAALRIVPTVAAPRPAAVLRRVAAPAGHLRVLPGTVWFAIVPVTLALKRVCAAADSPASRTNRRLWGRRHLSPRDLSRLVLSTALTLSIVLSAFGATPAPPREQPPRPRPSVVANMLTS